MTAKNYFDTKEQKSTFQSDWKTTIFLNLLSIAHFGAKYFGNLVQTKSIVFTGCTLERRCIDTGENILKGKSV